MCSERRVADSSELRLGGDQEILRWGGGGACVIEQKKWGRPVVAPIFRRPENTAVPSLGIKANDGRWEPTDAGCGPTDGGRTGRC